MPIAPDTKDWTWVLRRRCPDCGFDAGRFDAATSASRVRQFADQWNEVLRRSGVHIRLDDQTWSPLEYACHVRDVFRIYDGRLARMLAEDNPLYPNWDQDATAIEDRYDEQDPTIVARELRHAAEVLAARFDTVAGCQWTRTGRRGDGASFTVESLARYLVHDPVHHLHDVGYA